MSTTQVRKPSGRKEHVLLNRSPPQHFLSGISLTKVRQVVSQEEYLKARLALLTTEKEMTRANDALAEKRRTLPVVEVTKPYNFTAIHSDSGEETTVTLADLFDHRRQLIVYHFMFAPEWEAACIGCSMQGDHIPPLEYMHARDTSFVCVSRAPIAKLQAYKKRMGWTFPWVSSYGSDFNYDFDVTLDSNVKPVTYNFRDEEELKKHGQVHASRGEQHGASCFVLGGGPLGVGEEGKVYHTYSTYARGIEKMLPSLGWLDLSALGRRNQTQSPPADKRRYEFTAEDLKGTA
jgi:predicted dithiol-disulfide oxidoreductase (DUF899 family)